MAREPAVRGANTSMRGCGSLAASGRIPALDHRAVCQCRGSSNDHSTDLVATGARKTRDNVRLILRPKLPIGSAQPWFGQESISSRTPVRYRGCGRAQLLKFVCTDPSCPRRDTPPRYAAGTPSSRASTSFLRAFSEKDVDGRDEPGHDAGEGLSMTRMLPLGLARREAVRTGAFGSCLAPRSEEHTSELQSPDHLVCRLLLEKKKTCMHYTHITWHMAE